MVPISGYHIEKEQVNHRGWKAISAEKIVHSDILLTETQDAQNPPAGLIYRVFFFIFSLFQVPYLPLKLSDSNKLGGF